MFRKLFIGIFLLSLGLGSCDGDGAKQDSNTMPSKNKRTKRPKFPPRYHELSPLGKKEFERYATSSFELKEAVLNRLLVQEKTLEILTNALSERSRTKLNKESFEKLSQKIKRAEELRRLERRSGRDEEIDPQDDERGGGDIIQNFLREKQRELREEIAGLSVEDKQKFDEWKDNRETEPTVLEQLEWINIFKLNKQKRENLAILIGHLDEEQRARYERILADSESELSVDEKLDHATSIFQEQQDD